MAHDLFDEHFDDVDRLLTVFDNVEVDDRYFAVPPEWFDDEHDLQERNAVYSIEAVRLSTQSASGALRRADVGADQVDAIFFVSSTGFATPSLDSVLIGELGLRPDVRRDATFGHGCAGGAGGLARAADWARSHPGSIALLVATELCSLTLQRSDVSKTNLVATSLFGDGSASVVVGTVGEGPEVVADASIVWPDTHDVMGWTFGGTGMSVVLAKSVPVIVRRNFAASVGDVCTRAGMSPRDLRHYVLHPGGAAVLAAFEAALGLATHDLEWSRSVLRSCGNMSAPTVLFVLDRFMREANPAAGDAVLMSAMGPGFAAEHLVLRCT